MSFFRIFSLIIFVLLARRDEMSEISHHRKETLKHLTSGAIIALIGICGYNLPDAKVSIAFVDQIIPHSFSIWNAVVGLLAIDSLGVLLRWRFLDHAGHLGGMLTGLFYGKYGKQLWKSLPPVKSANKGPRG